VDHRSLKDQGVDDRWPQIHLGVAAAGMLERATKREALVQHPKVDRFRAIQQFNDRVADLDRAIAVERARLETEATERQHLEQQRQAWAWSMTQVAVSVLQTIQQATYEGKHYRFGWDGKTLTVEAKDGRGVLVRHRGDQWFVSDQITEADRDYCQTQGQALQPLLQGLALPPPPTVPKTYGER